MHWLSAVFEDFHFWVGMVAGIFGAVLLAWEHRRFLVQRQAREKDAHLRKYLGY